MGEVIVGEVALADLLLGMAGEGAGAIEGQTDAAGGGPGVAPGELGQSLRSAVSGLLEKQCAHWEEQASAVPETSGRIKNVQLNE
jgi:hypothetical protein